MNDIPSSSYKKIYQMPLRNGTQKRICRVKLNQSLRSQLRLEQTFDLRSTASLLTAIARNHENIIGCLASGIHNNNSESFWENFAAHCTQTLDDVIAVQKTAPATAMTR